ncbi:polyamine oxidase 6-like [Zingiber officinale]|uniref:Amine oxidase domain-containing protein n=1 Tax=Zingiber officinale TaxID=94328 RepID=A0A8J5G4K9_ZINOF|nr:polyamine oxidase 6-like [Zingiber officinale]KAG6498262.1 hypothetical protein ZIOFF_046174 [Zingiber officinale]
MACSVTLTLLLLLLLLTPCLGRSTTVSKSERPSVIIVGAGISGISAAVALARAGVHDVLILEATDSVGGRIHRKRFAGHQIEVGANWIQGVHGEKMNPIWQMAEKLHLKTFFSDYSNISSNTYSQSGVLYERSVVEQALKVSEKVVEDGGIYSHSLPSDGHEDISILGFQRIKKHAPATPLEMAVDYYTNDYESAEPPRVTSLQGTLPIRTFTDFGEDDYFVADERGFESLVHHLVNQSLDTDSIKLNQVVRSINQSRNGVTVTTENGSHYRADYVMVSVSIGVLQTDSIKFHPQLPQSKFSAICQLDMAVFTKIFLKFPYKFWPDRNKTEFFLYASERRGYYTIWQELEKELPGANVLLVVVTDDEAKRIELQPDESTKAEAMQVLKNMFGKKIPEATDIFVARWWTNRFFRGSFSNWPIGLHSHDFNRIKEPFGRIFFTGEHTSRLYNGYVHGAYLAGVDSANKLVQRIKKMERAKS